MLMDGETHDNVGREAPAIQETTPHVISWYASHDVHAPAPPPPRNIRKQKRDPVKGV